MVKSIIFSVIIISLMVQQFWIISSPIVLKPYMLVIVGTIPFFLFNMNRKINFPGSFLILFTLMIYLVSTSFLVDDISLSFNRTLGLLLLFTLIFYLFIYGDESKFNKRIILKFLLVYSCLSLSYYLVGLIASMKVEGYLEGFERGIYGLYLDGILPRYRGFLDSPNNAVIILFMILMYSLMDSSKLGNLLSFLTLLLILITFSFTGYIAVTFLILGYVLSRGIKAISASLLLVLFTIFLLLHFYLHDSTFSMLVDARVERLSTGSGRFELFSHSIELISNAPISGHGLAQARLLLEGFQGRDLQSTHNSFIEVFLEGGFLAITLYLLFWTMLFIDAIKSKVCWKSRVILFSYLVSLFVLNNSNNLFYVELMIFGLFWFYWVKRQLENDTYHQYCLN
ncbi:O-antigen ligase family protein [Vibrio sp. TRT 21S02]|uniref:O-antigen ligase family protein n=1 Tax=Vibrio sp. TRT 21S02 TaxID=3418507 RepID=UPI003CE67BB4